MPRSARGQITWVTLVLLVAVVGGGYLAWAWVPVYYRNIEAKQVVRSYVNRAIKDPFDAQLVAALCGDLARLDKIDLPGEDGKVAPVPAVEVSPDQVVWERDTRAQPPTLHVRIEYDAPVVYPFLDRVDRKTFVIELSEELVVPSWGVTK
jgi:hypothetical protein